MPRRLLAFILAVLALAGTASFAMAASTHWSNLKSVTVTLQNGSLPPPYGAAHVTKFATAAQVAKVTKALNANDIAKASHPNTSAGCSGGTNITIKIVPERGATVSLSAYRCGTETYGSIAGNVPGFVNAVGLSLP